MARSSHSHAKTIPTSELTAVIDLESGDDEITSAVLEGAEVEAYIPEVLVTGVREIAWVGGIVDHTLQVTLVVADC